MSYKPTGYAPYDFANRRHIGPSPREMAEMLQTVGAESLDAFIDTVVPAMNTGSSTANGVTAPVRPTLISIFVSVVWACSGGNL